MDMFFAAVAMLDFPELRDKPIAVGGMSMISTANYEARKYGVWSAMPGFIGKHLCPDLVFVDHQPDRYSEISGIFKGILWEYDERGESMGSDEMNLDVTDYLVEHGLNTEEGRF